MHVPLRVEDAPQKIVLMAAEGMSNTTIAAKQGLSMPTVGKWRERYRTKRVQGLYGEV